MFCDFRTQFPLSCSGCLRVWDGTTYSRLWAKAQCGNYKGHLLDSRAFSVINENTVCLNILHLGSLFLMPHNDAALLHCSPLCFPTIFLIFYALSEVSKSSCLAAFLTFIS